MPVTPQHTRLPGARHYTTDLPFRFSSLWAHGAAPKAETTRKYIYSALADRPAAPTPVRDFVAHFGAGRMMAAVEDGFLRAIDIFFDPVPALEFVT